MFAALGRESVNALNVSYGNYRKTITRARPQAEVYLDQALPARDNTSSLYIPERLKSVRSLERGIGAFRQSRERIFYHQALMLEDYTDDYIYDGEIGNPIPTYQSLSDAQLRGYFGWRTLTRNGTVMRAPLAYGRLYAFELIALIGAKDAEDAFCTLSSFAKAWGSYDQKLKKLISQWLVDMTVYYRLDPSLLKDNAIYKTDKAVSILLDPQDHSDEITGRAVFFLSGIDSAAVSSFGRKDRELLYTSLGRLSAKMGEYYSARRKVSFLEDYGIREVNRPVSLFAWAVFDERTSDECFDVKLNDVRSYHCERGRWSVRGFAKAGENISFRLLTETVCRVICEDNGPDTASCADRLCMTGTGFHTKWVLNIVRKTVRECRSAIERSEGRRVRIDMSQLDRIREDSVITMNRLLTDDDK